MNRFEEEGDEMLSDRTTISGITAMLADNPERVRTAMTLAGNNRDLRRYARSKQGENDVVGNIARAPMKDKLKIKKAAMAAHHIRVMKGVVCILVEPTGYAKKTFYPVKEKLEEFERVDINEEFGYLIAKHGGRTNKYSEKIAGTKVCGEFIFFRRQATEETPLAVTDILPSEFEARFPKVVTWKGKMN